MELDLVLVRLKLTPNMPLHYPTAEHMLVKVGTSLIESVIRWC